MLTCNVEIQRVTFYVGKDDTETIGIFGKPIHDDELTFIANPDTRITIDELQEIASILANYN